MRISMVLLLVLLFYVAVILPSVSCNIDCNYRMWPLNSHQSSLNYRVRRADSGYESEEDKKTTNNLEVVLEKGKIYSSQMGEWLENVGFLPVTINIPDVINGFMSFFGGGESSAFTPRKIFKMLSKMYKDITNDKELKEELKIISDHASEFTAEFKSVWEAVDFTEEVDTMLKFVE